MAELVLITGCSSGIGLSAAVECAAEGFRVVATMRNLERKAALLAAAKARQVQVAVEQLDVTATSAPHKVKELVLKYGPFFGLVNNAGIAFGGAFEEQSDEDVREQFETNVFGLMSITRALLPSMRAQGRGRIVNVSSLSGRIGLPGVSSYAATKHAVEGFSEALRFEVEPFGVRVALVEPGSFRTPIFGDNQRRASLADMDGPYARLNRMLERMAEEINAKAPGPDAVGLAIARILAGSSPPFRTIVGHDARALVALRQLMPDRLFGVGVRLFQRPLLQKTTVQRPHHRDEPPRRGERADGRGPAGVPPLSETGAAARSGHPAGSQPAGSQPAGSGSRPGSTSGR